MERSWLPAFSRHAARVLTLGCRSGCGLSWPQRLQEILRSRRRRSDDHYGSTTTTPTFRHAYGRATSSHTTVMGTKRRSSRNGWRCLYRPKADMGGLDTSLFQQYADKPILERDLFRATLNQCSIEFANQVDNLTITGHESTIRVR